MICFEWDARKASANRQKHGVTFEEAKSVFFDEHALQFFDDEHSESEERFILLGMSAKSRLLIVCHCERGSEDTIRIISARPATKKERRYYPGGSP